MMSAALLSRAAASRSPTAAMTCISIMNGINCSFKTMFKQLMHMLDAGRNCDVHEIWRPVSTSVCRCFILRTICDYVSLLKMRFTLPKVRFIETQSNSQKFSWTLVFSFISYSEHARIVHDSSEFDVLMRVTHGECTTHNSKVNHEVFDRNTEFSAHLPWL